MAHLCGTVDTAHDSNPDEQLGSGPRPTLHRLAPAVSTGEIAGQVLVQHLDLMEFECKCTSNSALRTAGRGRCDTHDRPARRGPAPPRPKPRARGRGQRAPTSNAPAAAQCALACQR